MVALPEHTGIFFVTQLLRVQPMRSRKQVAFRDPNQQPSPTLQSLSNQPTLAPPATGY